MQIPEKILYVSSDFHEVPADHEYNDLQRAINAIPAWGKYTLKLYSDFLDVRTLVLTNDNIQVKIDGQNSYGISFRSGDAICQLDAQKTLKFYDVTYIRGDIVTIRGDGNLGFYSCQSVMTKIDMVEGKYTNVYIYDTKFNGADRMPCVAIYNVDSKLNVSDSFMKGGRDNPAILFMCESDKKVKIKESSMHHYQQGEVPIKTDRGITAGLYIYNSVSSGRMCQNDEDGHVNNYVVNNNNILRESNIDY